MKLYIPIFAGAMLASMAYAGDVAPAKAMNKMACEGHACCRPPAQRAVTLGDPYAEERFRMKYGRNTPAEEARQEAARAVYAKNMLNCERYGCARVSAPKPAGVARAEGNGDPTAELRFRMKYGRNTPAEETRQKTAQAVYAKNLLNSKNSGCDEGSEPKPIATTKAAANNDPGAEVRFRMKYGRNTPAEELRLAREREAAKTVELASADRMICEPGCCDHTW